MRFKSYFALKGQFIVDKPLRQLILISAFVLSALAGSGAFASPLQALADTHRRARAAASDKNHEQASELYQAFIEKHVDAPEGALGRVQRGIILWRDMNDLPAAAEEFEAAAAFEGEGLVAEQAVRLGRVWLARIRMLHIARACREYYVNNVEYPENLDAMVQAKLLTAEQILDPWGDPYLFQSTPSPLLPAIPRQRYTLRSRHVKGEAREAQKYLDAEPHVAEALALRGFSDNPRGVRVAIKDELKMIEIGKEVSGLRALAADNIRALLCTDDFLVVLSR